jgi:hypothetical protein
VDGQQLVALLKPQCSTFIMNPACYQCPILKSVLDWMLVKWLRLVPCASTIVQFLTCALANLCFLQTNLNAALDTITDAVKELVAGQHAVVLLMDAARHVLWTSIIDTNTWAAAKLFRVQQEEGLIGACAADKQQVALCVSVRVLCTVLVLLACPVVSPAKLEYCITGIIGNSTCKLAADLCYSSLQYYSSFAGAALLTDVLRLVCLSV